MLCVAIICILAPFQVQAIDAATQWRRTKHIEGLSVLSVQYLYEWTNHFPGPEVDEFLLQTILLLWEMSPLVFMSCGIHL